MAKEGEPLEDNKTRKPWKDRSLWWWIGIVACAYFVVVIAAIAVNIIFPAPHWGDLAEHGCVLRDSLIFFYVCDGFTGANVLEIFRNLPTKTWAIPAFAVFGSPILLLNVAAFVVFIVAIAWGLRALARVYSAKM